MKLQLVDFETAKDLKELGFDWLVTKSFSPEGELQYSREIRLFPAVGFAAPEQALVCKWFRDVYKLSIEPGLIPNGYKSCVVSITDGYFNVIIGGSKFNTWPTYEEAELEGIKEVIKYLNDAKT